MVAYFRARRAGGRGLGRLLPERPAAEAPAAVAPLRTLAAELAGIPEWLLVECYAAVGDSAETVALLLPDAGCHVTTCRCTAGCSSASCPFASLDEAGQRAVILGRLGRAGRGRALRLQQADHGRLPRRRVAAAAGARALARVSGVDEHDAIAHRLMGDWDPTPGVLPLARRQRAVGRRRQPPLSLLPGSPAGRRARLRWGRSEWQAEWKWDGIRVAADQAAGRRVPVVAGRGAASPTAIPRSSRRRRRLPDGTVLDGELLPWRDGARAALRRAAAAHRAQDLGKKILADVPVVILAYDLLEWRGEDLRGRGR